MTGRNKKNKDSFELWRDRIFSVLVPVFLGYLLISGEASPQLRTLLIVLLVGFATGQAATFIRGAAKSIGAGIMEIDKAGKQAKSNKNDQTDQDSN